MAVHVLFIAAESHVSVTTQSIHTKQSSDRPATSERSISKISSTKIYRWNRERYSPLRRRIDIWFVVLRLLTESWLNNRSWSYLGGATDARKAARRQAQAIWLREALLNLGPTFIKVGQLFSTRADILPPEYVNELAKLQDQVPAFGYEQVQRIFQQDFGKPIHDLFRSFDPIPLAAASLGQVHRAKLHSGEEVVAKIQRPGLRQLFQIDLAILKVITRRFQNNPPDWAKGIEWMGIYEECHKILYEEIDYLNEGRNADRFRRNFRDQDWVRVPRVYWRYTSARVLTLEYLPGIKISQYEALEAAGLDRGTIANLGAQAYLQQILRDGFFHADPHPGNIAVATDGGLIFYDFGMMGRIKPITREKLMETMFGITQKDADRVIKALIDLEALVPTGDMGPVRRSIQYMLDNFMERSAEEQSIDEIIDDLYDIAYGRPFRFPATFTFVMRAFSTLQSVGQGLDPNFNFVTVAQPFAMQLMNDTGSSDQAGLLSELSRQAFQVSNTALALPRRIEDTLDKLERGDIRVRVRSTETDRMLRRLGNVNMGTNYTLLVGTFTLSATVLVVNGMIWLAAMAAAVALLSAIALVRVLLRVDRYEKSP